MDRKKLSAIIILVIAGTGLGLVSVQWMLQKPLQENTMGSLVFSNESNIKVIYGYGLIGQNPDFKELMAEERKKAIDIAISDNEVKNILKDKEYQVISVMDISASNSNNQEKNALVTINILGETMINVVVNLDKKIVDQKYWKNISMPRVLPQEPPIRLTGEEEKKASEIALADSYIQKILFGKQYNITNIESIPGMLGEGLIDQFRNIERQNIEQEKLEQYLQKQYALVIMDINESGNMTASMAVVVDLNESKMINMIIEKR